MDEIIHQPVRLKVMAALNVLGPGETIDFPKLKSIVAATDGNLGAHISTLEKAGYVTVEKDFVGRKPRTHVRMTRSGRRAFAEHVARLREILESGLDRT